MVQTQSKGETLARKKGYTLIARSTAYVALSDCDIVIPSHSILV